MATKKAEDLEAGSRTKEQEIPTAVIKLPYIPGAPDPVFVRVNEYTCYIKRGESVEVPEFVAEVLELSEQQREAAARAAQEAQQA